MCDRARCAMCGQVKLGLWMAWSDSLSENREDTGHVCYGCEDRVCNQIAAGRSSIRWLDTLEGCR